MGILVLSVVFLLLHCGGCITKIKVGVLLISQYGSPYDGERALPAIDMALEKVNNGILNSSYELVMVKRLYGRECSAANAPGNFSLFLNPYAAGS